MECVFKFHKNAVDFAEAQPNAGADGIQIVEPCCARTAPGTYHRLIQPLHTQLVELVDGRGGFARLHVCGDTNRRLPYTLGTGTHILDVDAAVRMDEAARALSPGQVLCGNLNPVELVSGGDPESIRQAVRDVCEKTGNRAILSGGCDIPQSASAKNMRAFYEACREMGG